jgi:hypothetical protein
VGLSESRKQGSVVAKTTVTVLTCDQCKVETGEDVEAEESVEFGYDGYNYASDLCAPHADGFHNTVQGFIEYSSGRSRSGRGRRAGRGAPSASTAQGETARRTTTDRERLRAIREWARANGYPDLGNRGRVPQNIVAEYEAAHGG